jgi:hypothetical protein
MNDMDCILMEEGIIRYVIILMGQDITVKIQITIVGEPNSNYLDHVTTSTYFKCFSMENF